MPERRQGGAHLGDERREGGMVDERPRTGVGEHVAELVRLVAVIDVHHDGARVVRAVHHLEPLGAVVHADRHVVLPRLPRIEPAALGVAPEAERPERVPDLPAAAQEGGVGEDAVPPDDRLAVRNEPGDQLLDDRQVNEHRRQ